MEYLRMFLMPDPPPGGDVPPPPDLPRLNPNNPGIPESPIDPGTLPDPEPVEDEG